MRALLTSTVLALAIVAGLTTPGDAGQRQLRGAMTHPLHFSVSDAEWRRELALLERAGANATRIDLAWSSLETEGKGRLTRDYVRRIDAVLREAERRGIAVIAMVFETPCWASSAPEELRQDCEGRWWQRGVTAYPPRDPNDYADAVRYIARRWGDRLAAIEIWNEPNEDVGRFLRAPDTAVAYAELVRAAAPAVESVAPRLPVLAGALSGSDVPYLQRLFDAGLGPHVDGISVHPYNEWRDPDDRGHPEYPKWSFRVGVPGVYRAMRANGHGEKGLWLTEFGFSDCGRGDRWCVSAKNQAEFVRDSMRIAARWRYVRAAILYELRDSGTARQDRESRFGLVSRRFRPKPAYRAFRDAMRRRYGETRLTRTRPARR